MEMTPQEKLEKGRYFSVAGGGLLALSVFLPWVHIFILGDLTFMQMSQIDHNQSAAWIVVAAGAIAALVAIAYEEKFRLRLWISFVAAALGLYQGIAMIKTLDKNYNEFIKIQFGTYIAILAGILLIIGIYLTYKASSSFN